jgi:hypothetical protein
MHILHILPKIHFELSMNEHGDVFEGERHLGELNLYSPNNNTLIGPTGPKGPTIKGERGPRGEMGKIGPTGPIGISILGPTGKQGIDGQNGLIGPCGIRGRIGPIGPTGDIGYRGGIRYETPRSFFHARVDKNFIYNDDPTFNYHLIPWKNIFNNGFSLTNSVIEFPKKYAVYKIELGLQLTNFISDQCNHSSDRYENPIVVELVFNSKCKKYATMIPYCQSTNFTLSVCESIHHIFSIYEDTKLEIKINTNGKNINIQNDMFINILEIM